jgi:N-acetylglucosamine-6-phosphate deacetylase
MITKVIKGQVVLPEEILENGLVVLEDDRIVEIRAASRAPEFEGIPFFDYGSNTIVPGFIDLHLHGAMGRDVMDGSPSGLEEIAAYQARHGVTGFVATTLAAPLSLLEKAVMGVKEASAKLMPADILGLHLEGPFLSLEKKGAQNPEFIRPIDEDTMDAVLRPCGGLRTVISVAPEVADNLSFIPGLKEAGLVVSIGHSAANYELALMSFTRGITHATHLYNAMSGFLPREPGVIGAVLDSDGVTAELIADGVHVHPAALRMAIRQKGVGRICLITDSLNAAGLGDGEYNVGGLEVIVGDGQARLKKGGALAGSILTMNRAVKNIIDWASLPVPQAVRMASLNPARVLGLDGRMGSIEVGKLANLAVLDRDFNAVATILGGRESWPGTYTE